MIFSVYVCSADLSIADVTETRTRTDTCGTINSGLGDDCQVVQILSLQLFFFLSHCELPSLSV